MNTHSSDRRARHSFGGTTMKTIASLAVGALFVASAGAALAQDITVTGEAEQVCELPDAWRFVSANNTVGGTFSAGANLWTIPSALLTTPAGMSAGAGGSDVAIRIRGESFCNTAHTIQLTSQNGGLVADAGPAPGFANRRTMKYDVYWSDGASNAFGGAGRTIQNFYPTSPGESRTATYTITSTVPPPGYRSFDIRMGLQRNAPNIPAQPMVAGAYRDVITVTLTPVS